MCISKIDCVCNLYFIYSLSAVTCACMLNSYRIYHYVRKLDSYKLLYNFQHILQHSNRVCIHVLIYNINIAHL